MKEQHSSRLRKIGACLHQRWNLRKESLLWTPVRQCTWSAKRTWVKLKWIPWRSRVVPTIVITANGEVQTHEEAIVYVNELGIFFTMKVLENTPAVLSLGKLCDENGYSYEWINGQKPHLIKNGIRIICNTENFVPIVVPGLSSSSSGSASTSRHLQDRRVIPHHLLQPHLLHLRQVKFKVKSEKIGMRVTSFHRSGRPDDTQANKIPKTNKEETTIERGDPLCSEIPEWLQEFRENLADDEIPVHGDSRASSSHEASLEPIFKRREDLGKHSVYTHFPKDRNCEICHRTKITRAPCRRRIGGAVPRAENFGDLITTDHKILGESWWISKQSSICNRGAGLGHPMDPVVSVQNKNFSGNPEKLAKVLGARQES